MAKDKAEESVKKDSTEETKPVYTIYKNRIYKYKDGSTTRVTYDSKDSNYEQINLN